MRRRVRITESDLHRIIKESVKMVLREKSVMDYSSEETKAMYDYDPNFAVSHNLTTNQYEPAPLGNTPYNEPEFPEDEQPYQFWNSLRDFDERHNYDPKQREREMRRDFEDAEMEKRWGHPNGNEVDSSGNYWDTNQNVMDFNEEGYGVGLDFDDKLKIRPTYRQAKNAGHKYLNHKYNTL